MYCRVSNRFRYCVAGERIILLDVKTARYLALPPGRERALLRLIDRCGGGDLDDRGLQELVADGILERAGGPGDLPRHAVLEPQTADYLASSSRSFAPAVFFQALRWELWTAAKLRVVAFPAMTGHICAARTPGRAGSTDMEEQVRGVTAAFERTGYILGRTDRCLVRSLAMFSLLRSMGIATRFVIAVRSDPFTAHCWVQRGGTVLNDVAEHVRSFTPIWVIE